MITGWNDLLDLNIIALILTPSLLDTCFAGIAPNSLIAKIASDWNKPNGQFSVEPTAEAVEAFISPLPIRKVSLLTNNLNLEPTNQDLSGLRL